MSHILFNLASRSRPARLYQTIEVLQAHLARPTEGYTILVKIDIDDRCDYSQLLTYQRVEVVLGRSRNKVDAINRSVLANGWDVLVNVSDDIRFTRPGFDNLIRQVTGPDDFVLFPEPFVDSQVVKGRNERISVMSVMGHQYYRRFGYVYHPAYSSLFCDTEATRVAEQLGRLKVVEEDIFYHEHPAAGYKQVQDAQYRRTEAFWDADKAIYYERKRNNFGL